MKPEPEFKIVDTTTLKGLKEAEKLHQQGWKQYRVGLFTTTFYRDKPHERPKQSL